MDIAADYGSEVRIKREMDRRRMGHPSPFDPEYIGYEEDEMEDRQRVEITIRELGKAIGHLRNAKETLGEYEWCGRVQEALEETTSARDGLKKTLELV